MGSTISVFAWNAAEGMLSAVQEAKITSGGPEVRSGSAELQLSNDGKFLYESNRLSRDYDRLPGTIGIYAVDTVKGTLSEGEYSASGGTMPRSFGIDPTGRYLFALHQLSNNVVQFKVDSVTGKFSKTGREIRVDTPVCIQFVPAH
jgi:6-phosphogluconolactonase